MESCVIVRKKGPSSGIVIIRSKSTSRSEPSCAKPCTMAVRSTRKKANDSVKKKGKDLSEDVAKDAQDQIQKLTDKLVKEIDALVAKKEKEVMTV